MELYNIKLTSHSGYPHEIYVIAENLANAEAIAIEACKVWWPESKREPRPTSFTIVAQEKRFRTGDSAKLVIQGRQIPNDCLDDNKGEA